MITKILNEKNINLQVVEFSIYFIKRLKELKIDELKIDNIDSYKEEISKKIKEYTPLRNEFIQLFEEVLTVQPHENLDSDIILDFLTNIYSLIKNKYGEVDNSLTIGTYKLILDELILYLISIALKYKNYYIIEEIIYSPYYYENNFHYTETKTFNDLNIIIKEEELRNINEKLIIERLYDNYTVDNLINVEALCWYISMFQENGENYWFPLTLRASYEKQYFDFFRKLDSKKYFEKVKGILNVKDVKELNTQMNELYNQAHRTNPYLINIIKESINLKDICTKR